MSLTILSLRRHLLPGVSGIDYRTETDKGDKDRLPNVPGGQVAPPEKYLG